MTLKRLTAFVVTVDRARCALSCRARTADGYRRAPRRTGAVRCAGRRRR